MNPKFNVAAIKCLEAGKLIQSVKDAKFKELVDRCTSDLTEVATALLTESTPVSDKKK